MKTKFFSEFFGTAFLLMVVIGSGIMGENLSGGNVGIALLANSIATGAGLFVLIQSLGHISGAHFNPVVSLVELLWRRLSFTDFLLYLGAQFSGAYLGVLLSHVMFNLPIFDISEVQRSGIHLWISEIIATFGLISVIALSGKKHVEFAPLSIAAYIMGAYWFTSSTSFANPAVTFARSLTNTFTGIAPEGAIPFVLAQILGALLAFGALKLLEKK